MLKTRWPEYSPRKVPDFAKYVVDANLFRLESSIRTGAKRVTNRNNVATEKRGGGIFRWGVYLEPLNGPVLQAPPPPQKVAKFDINVNEKFRFPPISLNLGSAYVSENSKKKNFAKQNFD